MLDKMIRIYMKIAISVILATNIDKFASTVWIWNDLAKVNLAHSNLTFYP